MYHLFLCSSTFIQDRFKIGRALPQLHKSCETFYRSNSRWSKASFDTLLKKAGFMWYGATKIHLDKSEVPIQR